MRVELSQAASLPHSIAQNAIEWATRHFPPVWRVLKISKM